MTIRKTTTFTVGQEYGQLLIKEIAQDKPRRYLCICLKCGHSYIYQSSQIKHFVDGCAYCHKKEREKNREDKLDVLKRKYIKKRFGKYKVMNIVYDKYTYYTEVKCSCGTESKVRLNSLLNGKSQMCVKCQRKSVARRFKKGRKEREVNLYSITAKIPSNNTSGHKGVYICVNNGSEKDPVRVSYRAYIGYKGTKYNLGRYKTFEDAVEARENAEKELMENGRLSIG